MLEFVIQEFQEELPIEKAGQFISACLGDGAFIDNGIPAVLFTSGITMKTNKTYDNAASLDYPVFQKRILLMFHWIEKML